MLESSEIVRGGFKAIKNHFKRNRADFVAAANASPVLLIQSGGKIMAKEDQKESLASRQIQFVLSQQLNLKTITSQAGHDSIHTFDRVQQKVDLVTRLGAATLVGVGDRATLDLTKAVADAANHFASSRNRQAIAQVILVPNTYEAVLSCTYPYSFLLHKESDVLIPHRLSTKRPKDDNDNENDSDNDSHDANDWFTSIACVDAAAFEVNERVRQQQQKLAVRACLAILLDAIEMNGNANEWQNPALFDLADPLIRTCRDLSEQLDILKRNTTRSSRNVKNEQNDVNFNDDNTVNEETVHQDIVNLLLQVGNEFMDFGLSKETHGRPQTNVRSTPLAVATSIWPTVFPDHSLLALLAATLDALEPDPCRSARDSGGLPLVTNESIDTLLSLVRQNQMEWNCSDTSPEAIRQLLRPFTLV